MKFKWERTVRVAQMSQMGDREAEEDREAGRDRQTDRQKTYIDVRERGVQTDR